MTHAVEIEGLTKVFRTGFFKQKSVLALDGLGEIGSSNRVGASARREQGRLVDEIREVGARESGREPRDLGGVDVAGEHDLPQMDCEDRNAALLVGSVDEHLTIETSGAKQRRIEDLGPVRRREQHEPLARVEAVELGQELIQRLLLLVVRADAGNAARNLSRTVT